MVLLFMDSHIKPILEGRKTRTTRIWKRRRVKPEGVYQARTELFGKPFALLRVKDVWRQEFNSLSLDPEHAKKEGYSSWEEFKDVFFYINPKVAKVTNYGSIPFSVWVVEFEVIFSWRKQHDRG